MQSKIRYGRVTYGKEWFRFYILYDLKIGQNFEMEICLVRGEGGGGEILSDHQGL